MGLNDILAQILWTQNFVDNQEYKVAPLTVFQDNKRAMLLENNGVLLSSKQNIST